MAASLKPQEGVVRDFISPAKADGKRVAMSNLSPARAKARFEKPG